MDHHLADCRRIGFEANLAVRILPGQDGQRNAPAAQIRDFEAVFTRFGSFDRIAAVKIRGGATNHGQCVTGPEKSDIGKGDGLPLPVNNAAADRYTLPQADIEAQQGHYYDKTLHMENGSIRKRRTPEF